MHTDRNGYSGLNSPRSLRRSEHPAFSLRRLALVLALAGLAGCATAERSPANIYPLKQAILAYVESGAYGREIAEVAAQARRWIEQRAAGSGAGAVGSGGKLTLVLDIDETLISNWPLIRAQDFGFVPAAWDEWVAAGNAPVIEPVREVYRTARRLGVDVVFLTGRHERDRAGTERNLRAIGCGEYSILICKPDDSQETSGAFKLGHRRRLAAEGRIIIANVGDQESDFADGGAERTFKLPNPFYLTP